jgi:putative toxin-antitoxin system antitoxin component (TIGR02293 family)
MTLERQNSILNLGTRSAMDIVTAVRIGLPAEQIATIAALGYDLQSIIGIVGPRTTIQRKIKEKSRLNAGESDRLSRFVRIAALAEQTFGDKRKAQAWLQRPSRSLAGGETPVSMLDTDQGVQWVERRLMQIAHEMFV